MASVGTSALQALLKMVGAPATPENLRFLEAWQQAEGGSASNNPFNTTQKAAGATSYNSVGVRNYPSLQGGLKATVETLLNGRYGNIVGDLRSGKAGAMKLAQDVAASPWGTGAGIERVLGGKVTNPGAGANPKGAQVSGDPGALAAQVAGDPSPAQALLGQLMQRTQAFATGRSSSTSPMQALQQMLLSANTPAPNTASSPASPRAPLASPITASAQTKVPLTGQYQGLKPDFLNRLEQAAGSLHASSINVDSGRRSAAHNAAVGGVPDSNHLTGDAADGYLIINGKQVPLGVALRAIAGKFGLRSGDVPGFFNGGLDPNHVDDGANRG